MGMIGARSKVPQAGRDFGAQTARWSGFLLRAQGIVKRILYLNGKEPLDIKLYATGVSKIGLVTKITARIFSLKFRIAIQPALYRSLAGKSQAPNDRKSIALPKHPASSM